MLGQKLDGKPELARRRAADRVVGEEQHVEALGSQVQCIVDQRLIRMVDSQALPSLHDRLELNPLDDVRVRLANLGAFAGPELPNAAAEVARESVRAAALRLELVDLAHSGGYDQHFDLVAAKFAPRKVGQGLAVDEHVYVGNDVQHVRSIVGRRLRGHAPDMEPNVWSGKVVPRRSQILVS
jgi:hypothetical protein